MGEWYEGGLYDLMHFVIQLAEAIPVLLLGWGVVVVITGDVLPIFLGGTRVMTTLRRRLVSCSDGVGIPRKRETR